jgi:RNA polymerase sigma-70 factor (ECF subfamily)
MLPALLPSIAAGDKPAVNEFLHRHTALVHGLARRVLRHPQDAEDAVQDIFLEIWRSAHRYDPTQGSETVFVTTIARRRLVDRIRRATARPAALTMDDPTVLPAHDTGLVELRDEAARARAALEQLKPEQREVLELSLGQGRSHQEIANSVGIPLGTVKSHARRGLIRLREMLGIEPDTRGGPA